MNLRRTNFFLAILAVALLSLPAAVTVSAQQYNENLFKGMKWRSIGPFRGGRVLAVTGVPGDPYTFYFGGVAGGVWQTTDGGTKWAPLFGKEHHPSIGANAVYQANPAVVYFGTCEARSREHNV